MGGRPRVDSVRVVGVGYMATFLVAAIGVAGLCGAQPNEPPTDSRPPPLEVVDAFEIGAVEARTGALLLSGQAGGNVDGALIWSLGERGEDDRTIVPFVVEVDGESLLSGRIGRSIAIGLYAYVVDDDGRVVDHIAQGLVLDPGVYADRIIASGLKFSGRFALRPGNFALRVMVQNRRTGSFFMSWSLLTLPAAEDPTPQLLPPLFPDAVSDWVVARQAGTGSSMVLGNGDGSLPSARPALVEDRPAEVWLGGGGWGENARVGIRIINELGRTVSEPVVKLGGPAVGTFGFRRATLAPVDLPPGDYTLIVTLLDDQTSEMLRRALPVVVVGDGDPQAWTSARAPDETGDETIVERVDQAEPKMNKKEIRAAYRRALLPLGEGDTVAARRLVAELERGVLADPSPKAVRNLGEAQYAESKALAKLNPDSLIPIALLHRELYRSYRARSEGVLAIHARTMTITLAAQFARLEPENGFSEGLMVNLAGDIAQMGAATAARDLLEQTLLFSPDYWPALLSLGFSFERNGEYFEATTNYRRLVETHPGLDEGRLRLAINLIRTGGNGPGVELLRGLMEAGGRPWVQTIAAQELVRYLVDKGSAGEAERAVRAALERMPDDQRLWILLAAILERSNRHREAIEAVADLPPASLEVSPRARYAEWPSLGVRASQSDLTARAIEAMPALRSALAAGGGAG